MWERLTALACYCVPQILTHPLPSKRRRSRSQSLPTFVAEPVAQSNSFVGTEEYISPVWSIFNFDNVHVLHGTPGASLSYQKHHSFSFYRF